MNPQISIIIPVYNSEEYLKQCLDSILSQDFEAYEILLINDGSTDGSGEICEAYAGKDKRIRVFHQPNAGVSNARNKGIEAAQGEWLTFVDSDDYIKEDYFGVLNQKTEADWLFLNIDREKDGQLQTHLRFENHSYARAEFIATFSLYPHFPGPYAKFFRTSLIKTHKLKFNPDLKFAEDALFNLKYLKFCGKITTTNASIYIYRDTEAGLSKVYFDFKNDSLLFEEMKKELELYRDTDFYSRSLLNPMGRFLKSLYWSENAPKSQRKKLLKKNIKEHYEICLKIYSSPKIKYLLMLAYKTGFYFLLDYVISKSTVKV